MRRSPFRQTVTTTREWVVLSFGLLGGVLVLVGSPLVWASADLPFLGSIELDGFHGHRNGWETLVFGALFLTGWLLPFPADRRIRWGWRPHSRPRPSLWCSSTRANCGPGSPWLKSWGWGWWTHRSGSG